MLGDSSSSLSGGGCKALSDLKIKGACGVVFVE